MAHPEQIKHTLTLNPNEKKPPTRTATSIKHDHLPSAKQSHSHPSGTSGSEDATLRFIGTATTILEWSGIRLMTDPNFLHAGGHVHLGPGVSGTRLTNPAVDLEDLPNIDVVLLSHYHGDHFDQKVEADLRRDLPIVTTPHAYHCLVEQKEAGEKFTEVKDLDFWETAFLPIEGAQAGEGGKVPALKVTGMPGKHVPPGPLEVANDLLHAVPPTNGWMLELGHGSQSDFQSGYRIYISGDTLLVDDLKKIPEMYTDASKPIDLMLIHLGGTTIPGPKMPLLMVTMDAKMGVKLMQLVRPDLTIPIHYDDYDVFLSPLEDFRMAVGEERLGEKVVYLDRGDEYKFEVRK